MSLDNAHFFTYSFCYHGYMSVSRELWEYCSQNQKDLIEEGQYLMNEIIKDHKYSFKDYSFLIFPFAKAYEGFLKQVFKDAKFISHLDYISDHLRLGKLLSPHLIQKLNGRSLYQKIVENGSEKLAETVWQTWKMGRNQIFHYFPHNLRAVSFAEANKTVDTIIETMELCHSMLSEMRVRSKLHSLAN